MTVFPSFSEFYEAVTGNPPFPWQASLADGVAEGHWPDLVDAPTGLGKTVCIHVGVWDLARRLHAGDMAAPRRIWHVIDRRVVVDQAAGDAEQIAAALAVAGPGSVLWTVAEALRSGSAVPGSSPLTVHRLRGGLGGLGLPDLTQPAVLCSTVDQYGSRLLFRGYGTSRSARPMHAALAVGSIVLADEAHMAGPLVDTVAAVNAFQAAAPAGVPHAGVTLVQLTATPTAQNLGRVHRISDRDRAHPLAGARLSVAKTVTGHTVKDDKQFVATAILLVQAAVLAGRRRVLVVVNAPALARKVHKALTDADLDTGLLIGKSRPAEREQVTATWLPRFAPPSRRAGTDGAYVLVATQTVEVGADLDADHLISQSCAWPSLRQRLGRLGRFGGGPYSCDLIFHKQSDTTTFDTKDPSKVTKTCPIYGPANQATYEWLAAQPGLDLGPGAPVVAAAACIPSQLVAPPLSTRTVERLVMTRPSVPAPDDPPVPMHLHGQPNSPDVRIVWRAHLDPVHDELVAEAGRVEGPWQRLLTGPWRPDPHETCTVPVWQAARWLARTQDQDTSPDTEDPTTTGKPVRYRALVIRDRELVALDHDPDQDRFAPLQPGDTILAPVSMGGHDQWGWDPASTAPVTDLSTVPAQPNRPVRAVIPVPDGYDPDLDPDLSAELAARAATRDGLAFPAGTQVAHERVPDTDLLLVWARASVTGDDEDDDSLSYTAGRVPLDQHNHAVAERAARHAAVLGLPANLATTVEGAGRIHDIGKAADQFWAALAGGTPVPYPSPVSAGLPVTEGRLAKSGTDPRSRSAQRARQIAGIPDGFRHEALSAELAEQLGLPEAADPLAVHLVLSHHGWARPDLPACTGTVTVDGQPAQNRYQTTATLGNAERFATLNREHGPWGLALIETVLRSADHQASSEGT